MLNNTCKRCASECTDSPPPKRGRPKLVSKLARYPETCEGAGLTDEVAVERNMEMIRKEMERDAPRKHQQLLLMKLTYPAMREFILLDSTEVTTTTILERFGALSLVLVVSSCLIAACSHCDTASAGHHHVTSLSCSFFGHTFLTVQL